MKRSSFPAFTAALLLGSLVGPMGLPCLQDSGIPGGPPAEKTLEQLIQDLGSSRFEDREAATRALKEKKGAESPLRKALKSEDAEVRRRAADILKVLARKRIPHGLAKALTLISEGRVIEACDRLVYCAKGDELEEGWIALMQLAGKVIDLIPPGPNRHTQKMSIRFRHLFSPPWFPAGDYYCFVNFVDITHPKVKQVSGRQVEIERPSALRRFVRGERITWGKILDETDGAASSILLASKYVHVPNAYRCLIIAGGIVKVDYMLRNSIIICDGDVELLGPAQSNLIIARGKVKALNSRFGDSMVRSEDMLRFPASKPIAITKKNHDPFAFVKFFELADVGLTAADRDYRDKPIREGVFLTEVRKKSPFTVGLRAGDVITALDGKKTPSKEDFRRLLRRKLAEGGPAITFTVRREETIREVTIRVKD